MTSLDFSDFDLFLRKHNGKIIHQIWFGTIPNKRAAKKAYDKLKLYRDSWKVKNPNWLHIEWNKDLCTNLVKFLYPEHQEMYQCYTYEIQRCDVIRYMILHRYGGLYADMDYYCNRPFDEALKKYPNDIYLVQSPNRVIGQDNDHISNSLMYSRPDHPFWRQALLELENSRNSMHFTKHLIVMFTTGPAVLNRIYSRYKFKYRVKSLPHKYFHPYGISDDVTSLSQNNDIFAVHIGKGSWEGSDSKFLLSISRNWRILLFILLVMIVPIIITGILSRKQRQRK